MTSFNITVKNTGVKPVSLHSLMIFGNKTIYFPPPPAVKVVLPWPQWPHEAMFMPPNSKLVLPNGTVLTDRLLNLTNAKMTLISSDNLTLSLLQSGNYSASQTYSLSGASISIFSVNKTTGLTTNRNIPLPNGTELVVSMNVHIPRSPLPSLINRAEGLAKNAPISYLINSSGDITVPSISVRSFPSYHGHGPSIVPPIGIVPPVGRPSVEESTSISSSGLGIGSISIGNMSIGNMSSVLSNLGINSSNLSVLSSINKTLNRLNVPSLSRGLAEALNSTNVSSSIVSTVNSALNTTGVSIVPSRSWINGYTLLPNKTVTISYTGILYIGANVPEVNGISYERPYAVLIPGNVYTLTILTQGGPVTYNVTAK